MMKDTKLVLVTRIVELETRLQTQKEQYAQQTRKMVEQEQGLALTKRELERKQGLETEFANQLNELKVRHE